MKEFDPESFVEQQTKAIKKAVGGEQALIAVSGGVDSTTCAVLSHRAMGENLLCVIIDTAFMREGEPERVAHILSLPPLNLPMKVLKVQERFLREMKGLRDAEEKRKKFRETFYRVLSETAENEDCRFLVQGTIQADIVETKGGVKTQHNVLAQIGISPKELYGFQVIEPVVSLYKEEVRKVARYLKIPEALSERQPFPGPGLSVRVVGEIRKDKLETLKKATAIAEQKFARHSPSQYFAAIIDNVEKPPDHFLVHIQEVATRFLRVPKRHLHVKVFEDKATGVEGGKRRYGEIAAITARTPDRQVHQAPIKDLVTLQIKIITENPQFTRILYTIKETSEKQPYVISLRAIQTRDFLTAEVSQIPWTTLSETAETILENCPNVSSVYYDVTTKPPATIEME
ncbi:MAG: GMP synthase [Candidatus Bathyarchaeum sp.]|nr:MAG: GMP synthase [Candidatus Bathyarchaeum sp.]